jgi:predicted ABC-type ATPase
MENKKPILIVIAGPNGSGKTSITSTILKHEWTIACKYINPDEIAQVELGDWNSHENILKAAKIATERRYLYLENGENIIFETVFSSFEKIEYLLKAHTKGYFIRVFFVATDSPTINASRITKRFLEGGHDVPIPKIISRYQKSIANICSISKIVDRLYIYDNSIENENAKLLFRASNGEITKVYKKVNDWAKSILETINF